MGALLTINVDTDVFTVQVILLLVVVVVVVFSLSFVHNHHPVLYPIFIDKHYCLPRSFFTSIFKWIIFCPMSNKFDIFHLFTFRPLILIFSSNKIVVIVQAS